MCECVLEYVRCVEKAGVRKDVWACVKVGMGVCGSTYGYVEEAGVRMGVCWCMYGCVLVYVWVCVGVCMGV